MNPGSRLGPYDVVAPRGAGAMGEVWRARDTRLSREVALKVLPVSTGPGFEPGQPKSLFKRGVNKSTATAMTLRWAVTSDGQNFVVNASRESRGLPFSVVLNWPAALPK